MKDVNQDRVIGEDLFAAVTYEGESDVTHLVETRASNIFEALDAQRRHRCEDVCKHQRFADLQVWHPLSAAEIALEKHRFLLLRESLPGSREFGDSLIKWIVSVHGSFNPSNTQARIQAMMDLLSDVMAGAPGLKIPQADWDALLCYAPKRLERYTLYPSWLIGSPEHTNVARLVALFPLMMYEESGVSGVAGLIPPNKSVDVHAAIRNIPGLSRELDIGYVCLAISRIVIQSDLNLSETKSLMEISLKDQPAAAFDLPSKSWMQGNSPFQHVTNVQLRLRYRSSSTSELETAQLVISLMVRLELDPVKQEPRLCMEAQVQVAGTEGLSPEKQAEAERIATCTSVVAYELIAGVDYK